MANLDNAINVVITTDAPPVTQKGFGTILILGEEGATPFADRKIRYYNGIEDVMQDAEDERYSDGILGAVLAVFSQASAVGRIAVYTVDDITTDYAAALDDVAGEDWYCVVAETMVSSDIKDIAEWCEAFKRLYVAQTADQDVVDNTGTNIAHFLANKGYEHTALIYHATQGERADAAWASACLSVNPDERTTTWRYKTLKGVTPQQLTATQVTSLDGLNCNVYGTFYGRGATSPGKVVSGIHCDIRVTIDWTLARCKESWANVLLSASNRGSKVPYDDEGFAIFEQATRNVLAQGEAVGHFIADSSFVRMPLRANVPAVDVQNRMLRFSFGAALAGAVETLSVTGTLSVDLDLINSLAGR